MTGEVSETGQIKGERSKVKVRREVGYLYYNEGKKNTRRERGHNTFAMLLSVQ